MDNNFHLTPKEIEQFPMYDKVDEMRESLKDLIKMVESSKYLSDETRDRLYEYLKRYEYEFYLLDGVIDDC